LENPVISIRKKPVADPDSHISYSQQGEDLIISYLLGWLQIQDIYYLDIGAHHPTFLSNTYLFYKRGHRGVCLEPDPVLCRNFKKERPQDTTLNIGTGVKQPTTQDFFVMYPPTLNTFSADEVRMYKKHYPESHVKKTLPIEMVPVSQVIEENFSRTPELVSIDTEGFDLEILKSFDFSKHRPAVFCIETIEYSGKNSLHKNSSITKLMRSHNYMLYGDTLINSIYVDYSLWQERKLPSIDNAFLK
jgi:FkbM family methyltransferase